MEYLRSITNVFGIFNSDKNEICETIKTNQKLIDNKINKYEKFDENINNSINNNMIYKIYKLHKNEKEIMERYPLIDKSKPKTKITYIRKIDLDET